MTDYTTWADKTVYDKEDNKVGTIDSLYLDDTTNVPAWATVKSSTLFGSKMHFAPVVMAEEFEDGIKFNVTKDQIKNAPSVDNDGELSEEDEGLLFQHYASAPDESATSDDASNDTSASDTDEAMTRSEEQLHVGKETQQVGKARLRKFIVTEQVQQTVPVSHEEVRLVREPITAENRDQAMSGAEISEEEHEVTLHAEKLVISKETVPVERVSLGTETVTEQQEVNESVRKEEVELDQE